MYISELTVSEIQPTHDLNIRERMLQLVDTFTVLPVGAEAKRLAQEYVRREVFSVSTAEDALHVAVAVVSRCDLVVSWNFRHLVNRRRRALINEANVLMSYPSIEIVAPPEV